MANANESGSGKWAKLHEAYGPRIKGSTSASQRWAKRMKNDKSFTTPFD
ncbi:MAG: hypothetical protein MJZ26_09030 [Fibrobacter sp.]|nr:hypothetical protein [Fibrobacter sp.]